MLRKSQRGEYPKTDTVGKRGQSHLQTWSLPAGTQATQAQSTRSQEGSSRVQPSCKEAWVEPVGLRSPQCRLSDGYLDLQSQGLGALRLL